ncbi:hypothetical protein SDC9_191743 [bioreactor metagenome]|uniref:Uncharacterized protein n=1 Tax=bioreactor metagenome TaxID=1076179 RepID=A0A645I0B1_9ZZZZ
MARRIRRFLKRIAAYARELLAPFVSVRRIVVRVAPVNNVALCVVGKRQPEVVRKGEVIHRVALDGGKRRRADIIARTGFGEPLGEFDLACDFPAGRVAQIRVDAVDVGFPA